MPQVQQSSPQRLSGFAPVIAPHCRAMVLGSFPGQASLAAGNYYAHPRNQFWPILSQVLGESLVELPFEQRYQALLARGLGLWDVIRDCERQGSLDQAIRSAQHAGLGGLAEQAPGLRFLLLNGRKAQSEARKALAAGPGHDYILLDLPSTSPAHAAMTAAQKLKHWQAALDRAGIGHNPLDTNQA